MAKKNFFPEILAFIFTNMNFRVLRAEAGFLIFGRVFLIAEPVSFHEVKKIRVLFIIIRLRSLTFKKKKGSFEGL